jgi:2-phosphosulfolactate phosphatase
VLCVDSLERALRMRAPGRVLAGEQHGRMPPGFDLGNSPRDVERGGAEELVLATTNGAPTIVAAARRAPLVLLACLLNLDAVRSQIAGAEVQIVCSGTYGQVALEDVYVAGRLCAGLAGERTDAALVAEAVARAHPSAYDVLAASANARSLIEAELGDDIEFCAGESLVDIVPRVERTRPGLAIVVGEVASPPASEAASEATSEAASEAASGAASPAVDGAGNVRSVVESGNPSSGRASEPQPTS